MDVPKTARLSVVSAAGFEAERGFWAVAVAVALGLVATIPQLRTRLRVLIAAAVAVVWVAGGLSSEALSGWRLGVVALGAVAWLHLLIAASRGPGPLFGFVTAIALGATAQAFLMFHAALLAQLGGALAMAMGLIGLSALVFRRPLPGVMALPLGSAMIVLSLDAALFSYEPRNGPGACSCSSWRRRSPRSFSSCAPRPSARPSG